jgi:hypothetical protein
MPETPTDCPSCGSSSINRLEKSRLKELRCDVAGCRACGLIWESFPSTGHVEDPYAAEPCDTCPFRLAGSQQGDTQKWSDLIQELAADPATGLIAGAFYCHKRVPATRDVYDGRFIFPTADDGQPDFSRLRLCSGYLRVLETTSGTNVPETAEAETADAEGPECGGWGADRE